MQRLANPLLPWNPFPKLADGTTANPDYKPNIPVNPYLTVDTSSVNLTAFNGASEEEGDYPDKNKGNTTQTRLLQLRPWGPEVNDYLNNFQNGKQVFCFRSLERGSWSRLNVLGSAASPATSPPQRVLWAQEPAMVTLKKDDFDLFDLIPGRQMTMRKVEVDSTLLNDPNQPILDNHMNMVVEHTLGFGNKSFGMLYDARARRQRPLL